MVHIIEETSDVKEEDPSLESSCMSSLNVMDEGHACIKAQIMHLTTKLVSGNQLMCNDVVLELLGNCFLH